MLADYNRNITKLGRRGWQCLCGECGERNSGREGGLTGKVTLEERLEHEGVGHVASGERVYPVEGTIMAKAPKR